MQDGRASHTARYMALFRAIESTRRPGRRLFHDPLARLFLSPKLRLAAAVVAVPLIGNIIPWILDLFWPGARTSAIARTRFIDDRLRRALQEGYNQVVILGAGFDSRPYRMAELANTTVIEVDHPATSREKQRALRSGIHGLPLNVQFLEIDFNAEGLQNAMQRVAFDPLAPTVIVWEGVTNYLAEEAVDSTFQSLRAIFARCLVLFTYINRAVLESSGSFDGTSSVEQRLKKVGERWTFGFDPAALPVYLGARGYDLLEDVGSVQYRTAYLPTRRRLLRGYEFYRIAAAQSGEA